MSKVRKQNFLEGAMIMAVANIVVKIIGAFFKIPLKNLIGSDGMGMFYGAYNVYSALVIISTAGLPVVVSRMVAEANVKGRAREIDRIFKLSFRLFFSLGLLSMLIMILFARPLLAFEGNPDAYPSLIALAPAIFFVAVMSAYRGYCQGMSNMVPTAVSQFIEALCKLVLGYGLAYLALKRGMGVEYASAGAILGVTIGSVLGTVYMAFRQHQMRDNVKLADLDPTVRSNRELTRVIVSLAIPITIGAAVMSITNLMDNLVVMRCLQAIGYSESDATYIYGMYSSMPVALMTMPQTLIVGMTVSLVPAISAACGKKDYVKARQHTESAMRLTGLMTFPCAVGLFTLARPLLNLLYRNDVDMAAPLLKPLAFAFICVALVSVTNSVMQAAGKERLPVISMVAGGVVKLVTNYTLIRIPDINIHGAPIGTIACYGVIALINIIFVYTKTPIGPRKWYQLWKPAFAAVIMGLFAYLLYPVAEEILGAKLGCVLILGACVVVYFGILLGIKGFVREDIQTLPKGDKLCRLLRL